MKVLAHKSSETLLEYNQDKVPRWGKSCNYILIILGITVILCSCRLVQEKYIESEPPVTDFKKHFFLLIYRRQHFRIIN